MHLLEERLVAHAEGDLLEVDLVRVVLARGSRGLQHRCRAAKHRATTAVDLGGLGDDMQRHRRRGRQQRLVLGDMHREMGEIAGGREIEVVVDRLRPVRLEFHMDAAGRLALQSGHRADRYLQEDIELLPGRRGVGHHDMAAVEGVGEELAGDELVDLLAVDLLDSGRRAGRSSG